MIEHTPTVKKQHRDERAHLVVKKQHRDETPDGPSSEKGDTAGRVTSLLLGSHYLSHVKERTSFVDSQEYVVKFIIA